MAIVAVERVVLVFEIGDEYAGIPGVQIISDSHSHAALFGAIAIHCGSRFQADVFEFLAALIAI